MDPRISAWEDGLGDSSRKRLHPNMKPGHVSCTPSSRVTDRVYECRVGLGTQTEMEFVPHVFCLSCLWKKFSQRVSFNLREVEKKKCRNRGKQFTKTKAFSHEAQSRMSSSSSRAIDILSHVLGAVSQILKPPAAEEVNYTMSRLTPRQKRMSFQELASRKWEQTNPEREDQLYLKDSR